MFVRSYIMYNFTHMKAPHNTPALQAFSKAITLARQAAGIKQEIAAKALGITRSTLSRYENGNLEGLTISTLFCMSQLYQLPMVHFFTEAKQNNGNPPPENLHTLFTASENTPEDIEKLKQALTFLLARLK